MLSSSTSIHRHAAAVTTVHPIPPRAPPPHRSRSTPLLTSCLVSYGQQHYLLHGLRSAGARTWIRQEGERWWSRLALFPNSLQQTEHAAQFGTARTRARASTSFAAARQRWWGRPRAGADTERVGSW